MMMMRGGSLGVWGLQTQAKRQNGTSIMISEAEKISITHARGISDKHNPLSDSVFGSKTWHALVRGWVCEEHDALSLSA